MLFSHLVFQSREKKSLAKRRQNVACSLEDILHFQSGGKDSHIEDSPVPDVKRFKSNILKNVPLGLSAKYILA